jgi:hypothetical protein
MGWWAWGVWDFGGWESGYGMWVWGLLEEFLMFLKLGMLEMG